VESSDTTCTYFAALRVTANTMKGRLLVLMIVTLSSCQFVGDRVDTNKLPGRYLFKAGGQDTLDVYPDGTYLYYRWWNGKKLKNAGTWTHNVGMGMVDFKNFSFLTDSMRIADSTFLPRGTWSTRIRTSNNDIRFVYASDVDRAYFLRVDSVAKTD
jgi:hypothetical protein